MLHVSDGFLTLESTKANFSFLDMLVVAIGSRIGLGGRTL